MKLTARDMTRKILSGVFLRTSHTPAGDVLLMSHAGIGVSRPVSRAISGGKQQMYPQNTPVSAKIAIENQLV
ncbi:hypothetical protein [Sphingomonas sp. LT1P40]|uniref:hypothetical protein n=1 Tax=Alteristakelama amylovorans TaxID=3096166 RepID=UPI002FCC18E2